MPRYRQSPLNRLAREADEVRREFSALLEQGSPGFEGPENPDRSWESVVDAALQASLDQQVEIARQRLAEKSRALAAAEARVREGKYGVCQLCGGRIARRRLEAIPTATRCVRCQEECEAR